MKKWAENGLGDKRVAEGLKELQQTLLSLEDELTETMAWTALLCDGLCGILAEHAQGIDSAAHTGVRFATIWLKQRNEGHATTLHAACRKLREIRERAMKLANALHRL